MVCLIKPQFEAGREKVGKKGVVRDPAVHEEVISRILGVAEEDGFDVLGLTYSPVKGPEGNIEYLVRLKKRGGDPSAEGTAEKASEAVIDAARSDQPSDAVSAIVTEAHRALD